MTPPNLAAGSPVSLASDSVALDPADRLIVALDYPTAEAALGLASQLAGICHWFKVGMELYYSAGPSIVERLLARDMQVFLDLKLHDIPNTVAGAVRSIATTGAGLLTVHAGGGERMMRAAAEAAASTAGAPQLLAVTVLTSMDASDLAGIGVADSPEVQVLRLAKLARLAGIDGLVCSAEEVAAVRGVMGPEARLVIPGIRPAVAGGTVADDQRRTATPAEAIARGASMLVVGRPITAAADPRAAAMSILAEIRSAT
jgi:orotidine-5'-phosphate decarboxylase